MLQSDCPRSHKSDCTFKISPYTYCVGSFFMYTCKHCNVNFQKYESLRKHCGKTHKIHTSQTCIDYLLGGTHPVCVCGCGKPTKWHGKNKGHNKFNPYIIGHNNRVINNWGHNKQAQIKSAETRRTQYASGERRGWCYGLSIETDERVKKLAEKTKLSIGSNPDELKRRSERMTKHRNDGTIPTLYREKSSRWKGGVSLIQSVARNDKRLYDHWKHPILKRDMYKCIECQSTKDLHVHHDRETFSEIIKKVMTIDDYDNIDSFETKKYVTDKIVEYHVKNATSGITLCKVCHNKHHPSLNF